MSIRTATAMAFQSSGGGRRSAINTAPEPDRSHPEAALPEREWGLSAGQVVAVVAAIVAACELFAILV